MVHKYGVRAILPGLALMGAAYPLAQESERQGIPWWAYVLIVLVLLAFAAFVIWWWLHRKPEPEIAVPHRVGEVKPGAAPIPPAVLSEAPAVAAEMPKVEVPLVAEVKAAAVPPMPDDLKLIEGIGPRIAGILNATGIMTFGQLAALDADRIRKMLELADPRLLRLADPTTWPEQARLAAAGDWDAFRKLQDELKGGRRS